MKKISVAVLFFVLIPFCACAQDQSWETRKQARFKPLSDQQRADIRAASPEDLAAKPKQPRRILVFYRCEGFIHTSIPHGNAALQSMGEKTGAFDVDLADTYDVFTEENLAKYDAIVLNSTSHLAFPEPTQHNAFLDFVINGGGLVGIHAASDNFGKHPKCLALVGGIFNGHPWNAGGTWAFKLDDPEHTLNRAFDGKGFWYQDEIYQYKPESYEGVEKLRLLVSLDMTKKEVSSRINDGPREVPVSWVRKAGDGRVFYTNFGHREETYQNPAILRHILDGIQFATGDLDVDTEPTANAKIEEAALAPTRERQ